MWSRGFICANQRSDGLDELLQQHLPDIHCIHPRVTDGLHAQIGVFVGAAKLRFNADAARGFEKNIRRGLLIVHHFAGHHGVEQMPNLQMFQDLVDDDFVPPEATAIGIFP